MIVEELYDALIEAGASEEKARAASRAVADMEKHFANTEKGILGLDRKISELRSYIDQRISQVDQQISELRSYIDQRVSQVDQQISELRLYADQQIWGLRSYVDQGFTEIRGTLRLHDWMLGTILAFILAIFFKVFSH